jgi:hypothetical protein
MAEVELPNAEELSLFLINGFFLIFQIFFFH